MVCLGRPHYFVFLKAVFHTTLSQILLYSKYSNDRSSCSELFCEKGALKHFAKFTGNRESNSSVFLGVLRNFLEHMFYKTSE